MAVNAAPDMEKRVEIIGGRAAKQAMCPIGSLAPMMMKCRGEQSEGRHRRCISSCLILFIAAFLFPIVALLLFSAFLHPCIPIFSSYDAAVAAACLHASCILIFRSI